MDFEMQKDFVMRLVKGRQKATDLHSEIVMQKVTAMHLPMHLGFDWQKPKHLVIEKRSDSEKQMVIARLMVTDLHLVIEKRLGSEKQKATEMLMHLNLEM